MMRWIILKPSIPEKQESGFKTQNRESVLLPSLLEGECVCVHVGVGLGARGRGRDMRYAMEAGRLQEDTEMRVCAAHNLLESGCLGLHVHV